MTTNNRGGFLSRAIYNSGLGIPENLYYENTLIADSILKNPSNGGYSYPLAKIRADFPILSQKINGYPLVWLDNAATTQRPEAVIQRLKNYYERENSNIHRGAHTLSRLSTDAYENARQRVADFLNAERDEIVFTRGSTEGINLIANAYVKPLLKKKYRNGGEIIITVLEHHSNIVPWQLLANQARAVVRVAPVDCSGRIIIDEYAKLFNKNTAFVSAAYVSNALGTIAPIKRMIDIAHENGAAILVDGAQAVSHMPVDLRGLDADFFVFSGHKIYAPT
ncbi:MAG: aminotransferase class V-fold PLP-dependent enzyme, partial [Clostridiales bacterium]|nr:aminotransferase class V-fold PLP-dependent enzyme [Clostridiales bacterium]